MSDLVLFGVGSDGSVAQFDGGKLPSGILLRWIQSPSVGFPDYGYELERASVPDLESLDWSVLINDIVGQTSFLFHNGTIELSSNQPLDFSQADGSLKVPSGAYISVKFADPVWWLSVQGRPSGVELTLRGLVSGEVKLEQQLAGLPVEWRTRGLDEIRVVGEGELQNILFQGLDRPRKWEHVADVGLPVIDSRYPAAAAGASDEAVASARVPQDVDWATRYHPGFADLDAVLVALAAGDPVPGGGPITANPSSTTQPPSATVDPLAALQLAMLDPHLARVVGVLYDDDLAPHQLDGRAWAYRVTGRWAGIMRPVPLTEAGLGGARLSLTVGGTALRAGVGRGRQITVPSTLTIDATQIRRGLRAVRATGTVRTDTNWEVVDDQGGRRAGVWQVGTERVTLRPPGSRPIATITIDSGARWVLSGLSVEGPAIERASILPYVLARGASEPAPPSSLHVEVSTPGGAGEPARAGLTWDLTVGADPFGGGVVTYQVAAAQVTSDPTVPEPAAPSPTREALVDGGALKLPSANAAPAGAPLAIDRPLPEGWRAWWVYGVDLFGRVSAPCGPELARVVDDARPPPPVILAAEYAQLGIDAQLGALLGRSSAGQAWLGAQPDTGGSSAAIVTFGWTPDLDARASDVDAFRLYARTPNSDGTWTGRGWGQPIAALGAFPVRFKGAVQSVATDLAAIDIASVEPVTETQSRCHTNLRVDVAGALTGAELSSQGRPGTVTSHGEGASAILIVSHDKAAPPKRGAATLRAGGAEVRKLVTAVSAPALSSSPHRQRVAGVLVAGTGRFLVAAESSGTFLVQPLEGASIPAQGDAVTWYPAYRVAVADTGFGPVPDASHPDAVAQLAVTSVRRSTVRPAESPPCAPATVHAVDNTPPPAPTLPPIPSGKHCAQLASAADWHGISRFTLTWNPVAQATGYHVHRAMADTVRLADTQAHGTGAAAVAHKIAASALPADPARAEAVKADIAALDAALGAGNTDAIRAAYRAMRSDAWQIIASQEAVAGAFVQLNGLPLPATAASFEDRFDGVADAHWLYRVSSRNAGGLESGLSSSTPPICAPRVTPPSPPQGLLALAGDAKVTLRFAPSASSGIVRYLVFRSHDAQVAADVREMLEQAKLAATPTSTPAGGEKVPTADGSALRWDDTTATPGRDWFYRLVAEDQWGNRSEPSALLSARSLHPIPEPPVWKAPVRSVTGVTLSWTHLNPRMASRIERRQPGAMWRVITEGWLPRGQYQFSDTPPDLAAAWEYRLSVRDHGDQLAPSLPVVTLAALP